MNQDSFPELYAEHLETKRTGFSSALGRMAVSIPDFNIIPTDVTRGFRSRMKFKLYRRGNLRAVGTDPIRGESPAADCLWALPDWGRESAAAVLDYLTVRDTDYPVDGAEIQLAHGREEMFVLLSVGRRREFSYLQLAEDLLSAFPWMTGVAVPSQKIETGISELRHLVLGRDIEAHYSAFFQSNLQLTSRLVEAVRGRCFESETGRLLDLYCGVGLHAVFAGQAFSGVRGVDISSRSILNARANCASAGIQEASFFEGTVESFVQSNKIQPTDLVILNPPRSGIGEKVIRVVAAGEPERVIVISCDPDTQSRDLRFFQKYGYKILDMAAFDMFPFSRFLETVAVLSWK
jgi:tRNA/tmRNA/rRNA uracil-C5-methylase (TrmA/RlmC/RlmD family)